MKKSILIIGLVLLMTSLVACTSPQDTLATEPAQQPQVTEATTEASVSEVKTKSETEGFMKGYKAIDVSLKDLDGNPFVLSEQTGKVVVLNFWASWCPPCNEEIPYFNEAYKEVQGTDVVIIGIDLIDSDTLKDVEAKIAEHNIQYPIALDEGSIVANAYRVRNIPTTVIVRPDGVIHDVFVGALNKDALLTFIEEAKK